jgi:hypothetical protein
MVLSTRVGPIRARHNGPSVQSVEILITKVTDVRTPAVIARKLRLDAVTMHVANGRGFSTEQKKETALGLGRCYAN